MEDVGTKVGNSISPELINRALKNAERQEASEEGSGKRSFASRFARQAALALAILTPALGIAQTAETAPVKTLSKAEQKIETKKNLQLAELKAKIEIAQKRMELQNIEHPAKPVTPEQGIGTPNQNNIKLQEALRTKTTKKDIYETNAKGEYILDNDGRKIVIGYEETTVQDGTNNTLKKQPAKTIFTDPRYINNGQFSNGVEQPIFVNNGVRRPSDRVIIENPNPIPNTITLHTQNPPERR